MKKVKRDENFWIMARGWDGDSTPTELPNTARNR
jgi:hypothetical protein